MRLVRLSYALQDRKLDGTLRSNDTGREEPFTLTMTQMIIRFLFDNPKQIVHLDLAAAGRRLQHRDGRGDAHWLWPCLFAAVPPTSPESADELLPRR